MHRPGAIGRSSATAATDRRSGDPTAVGACYKAIACDTTEDKKHIDLSSEPLTLICAAGLVGSVADDAAKEVAIFRAHKGALIVIASEGEPRFGAAAVGVIPCPEPTPHSPTCCPPWPGICSAMRRWPLMPRCYRCGRPVQPVERVAATTRTAHELLERLGPELRDPAAAFHHGLRNGRYDGAMEARTATWLSAAFRYVTGAIPLELYEREQDNPANPSGVIDDLTAALTAGIDELTRPVDASSTRPRP